MCIGNTQHLTAQKRTVVFLTPHRAFTTGASIVFLSNLFLKPSTCKPFGCGLTELAPQCGYSNSKKGFMLSLRYYDSM